MIAYDELAAALERWRIRQGLPATPALFADGRPASAPPVVHAAPAAVPPPAPRPTQSIAAAPPPPAAVPVPVPVAAAPVPRTPPPPPSGRSTIIGMTAPVIPPSAAPVPVRAASEGGELYEADVLEESGDPNARAAAGFDENEATRAGELGGAAAWPEVNTVATQGWGQAPASTIEVDDVEEATHIGEPTRHD